MSEEKLSSLLEKILGKLEELEKRSISQSEVKSTASSKHGAETLLECPECKRILTEFVASIAKPDPKKLIEEFKDDIYKLIDGRIEEYERRRREEGEKKEGKGWLLW